MIIRRRIAVTWGGKRNKRFNYLINSEWKRLYFQANAFHCHHTACIQEIFCSVWIKSTFPRPACQCLSVSFVEVPKEDKEAALLSRELERSRLQRDVPSFFFSFRNLWQICVTLSHHLTHITHWGCDSTSELIFFYPSMLFCFSLFNLSVAIHTSIALACRAVRRNLSESLFRWRHHPQSNDATAVK